MKPAGGNTERPVLDASISLTDFNEFYWLKEELVAFYREISLRTAGGKIALAENIRAFLATDHLPSSSGSSRKPESGFGWHGQLLHNSTAISGSYKNTEHIRSFFKEKIGSRFSSNVPFMRWMSESAGQTLGEAVEEWRELDSAKKQANHTTRIAPQFGYNRCMRAFLADNHGRTSKDAVKFWKLKSWQRGTQEYERADLTLS